MGFIPRIGQINALLIALYFVPLTGHDAVRSLMSPVYGLDSRVNLGAAAFYRELLDLGGDGLARVATALASLKLVMAAMFVALGIDVARGLLMRRDSDPATVDLALFIATVTIIIWAVPAYALGQADLIRLYATHFLMITGAVIVLMVERAVRHRPERVTRAQLWLALSEVEKARMDAAVAAHPPVSNVTKLERGRIREPAHTA